ncbi:hydroxymethylglutaryl-CoA lyase [Rhodocytophaga rosea]|uniref:Hydroxymethylglutaryl-CoA lyase n=2 Tax=Rhodocytophaga rosea TaxID=2704465 RepID=A0A6C0GVA2_9BACT|nr:hydroxymethylglutaryl-CoA lyase [Rhodocytophaga rosea]
MQGLHGFIDTTIKAAYINTLLRVGFDTIDFGSFVSSKAVPQMRDTAEVLTKLDLSGAKSKLLAIIANLRGAEQATIFEEITYLGFPLSLSETFQQRNTNKSISQALEEVALIQNLCLKHSKQLVVYLSMGFGNPYGDIYNPVIAGELTEKLINLGISIIAPSDTIGCATPETIEALFTTLLLAFPKVEFGAHLHSTPDTISEKLQAAFNAGCRRFDGAIRGFGGCPMAADELTGNMATEKMIDFFEQQHIDLHLDKAIFGEAYQYASQVFSV